MTVCKPVGNEGKRRGIRIAKRTRHFWIASTSLAQPSPFLAMTKISAIATAALLASYASAHTIFQKLYVNGVDQGELTGIRAPDYDGVRICLLAGSRPILTGRIQPIQDVTSNDIICNGGSSSSSEHERSTTDSLLRYQSLPPARLYGCDQRPCWCNSHC